MILCNCVMPLSLFSQKCRRNTVWLWILSIFINLGMWFERFVIFIPSLSHEFEPWQWHYYTPTWVDISILCGSFGWFFMWFLLFYPADADHGDLRELKEITLRSRGTDRGVARRPRTLAGTAHLAAEAVAGAGRGGLMRGVVGAFQDTDAAIAAIQEAKRKRWGDITVYMPAPDFDIEEGHRRGA